MILILNFIFKAQEIGVISKASEHHSKETLLLAAQKPVRESVREKLSFSLQEPRLRSEWALCTALLYPRGSPDSLLSPWVLEQELLSGKQGSVSSCAVCVAASKLGMPRKTNVSCRTANAAGGTCKICMCWTPGMSVWFCQGRHHAVGTTKVKILTHVNFWFNFSLLLFFRRVILFLGLFHNFLWVFQVNYKIVFVFFYFHFDEGWAWGRSTG